jgi:cytochrome c peroxidase
MASTPGSPSHRLGNPKSVCHKRAAYAGRLLGFRSPILAEIAPLSSSDVDLLEEFLHSLSSPTVMSDVVAIPVTVPSGDKAFVRR